MLAVLASSARLRRAYAWLRAAPRDPLPSAARIGHMVMWAMGEGRLRRGLRAQSGGEGDQARLQACAWLRTRANGLLRVARPRLVGRAGRAPDNALFHSNNDASASTRAPAFIAIDEVDKRPNASN